MNQIKVTPPPKLSKESTLWAINAKLWRSDYRKPLKFSNQFILKNEILKSFVYKHKANISFMDLALEKQPRKLRYTFLSS